MNHRVNLSKLKELAWCSVFLRYKTYQSVVQLAVFYFDSIFCTFFIHLWYNVCSWRLTVSSRSATVDLVTLRKREKKWLYMLSNWSHFMNNKYEKVRERCRKGIPPSLRGRAWKHLCGATFHMEFSVNRHVFEVGICFFPFAFIFSKYLHAVFDGDYAILWSRIRIEEFASVELFPPHSI